MISGCFSNPRVRPKGAEGGRGFSDAELCYNCNAAIIRNKLRLFEPRRPKPLPAEAC